MSDHPLIVNGAAGKMVVFLDSGGGGTVSDPGHSAFGGLASWQSSGAATGFQVFP